MTNVVVGKKSTVQVLSSNNALGIRTEAVIVGTKRNVQISANATAGIIDTSTPVVLKNNPYLVSSNGIGPNRLDKLYDVSATGEVDKATLVYYSANDTYVVEKLDLANVTGGLDGGTF